MLSLPTSLESPDGAAPNIPERLLPRRVREAGPASSNCAPGAHCAGIRRMHGALYGLTTSRKTRPLLATIRQRAQYRAVATLCDPPLPAAARGKPKGACDLPCALPGGAWYSSRVFTFRIRRQRATMQMPARRGCFQTAARPRMAAASAPCGDCAALQPPILAGLYWSAAYRTRTPSAGSSS